MSKLANCTITSKVVRALRRAGFQAEQGANHAILLHPDGRYTTVPRHPRIKLNTLRAILKQCDLTEDEFCKLY